jgi:signal transduction histidine kinase
VGYNVLHDFLAENHAELIDRCRAKVALRQAPRATPDEIEHGIPLFLGQLTETLRAGHAARAAGDSQPACTPDDDKELPSAMRAGATEHGHELRKRGYTVNQVVHGYGDLCQAITELAIQERASVSSEDFKTLNGCLDNAIASAVTEFAREREEMISESESRAMSERLGFLAHELRNFLNTAILSFAAIKSGSVAVNGATSAIVDRSLVGLRDLIDHALADVRLEAGMPTRLEPVAVDRFIAEAQVSAALGARAKGCSFTVAPVERGLRVCVDKQMLSSAVSNLLQNAFKFTRSHSHVTLRAYGRGERVLIEVEDECGGLPAGKEITLFTSFQQHGADRSGLGLGLSISRRAVEACGGTLGVRDMPGLGCVFTIDLPRLAGTGAAA